MIIANELLITNLLITKKYYIKSIFHISRLIISIILILFTISACSGRKAMIFLDKADALLDLHPDSSLYIIREIDSSELITRNQIATYRLLKDAALFKTGMDLPDDSLSRFARSFFIKRSLHSRKKDACLLLGSAPLFKIKQSKEYWHTVKMKQIRQNQMN